MTRPVLYLPLVACLLVGTSAGAQGPQRPACLAPPAAATGTKGEAKEAWLAALRIETRKAGQPWAWVRLEPPARCAAAAPVVSFAGPDRVVLTLPGGRERKLDLSGVAAGERARSLARSVVQALSEVAGEDDGRPLPLLGRDEDISLGNVSATSDIGEADIGEASEQTPSLVAPTLLARVGGTWLHQFGSDRHLVGPTLEAGVSLHQGRLAFALLAAYLVGPEVDVGGILVDVTCGELMLMARGGHRVGAVVIGGGLGMGWQRRDVEAAGPRSGATDAFASSDAGIVAVDLEVTWYFAERWHLSALVPTRIYFGAPEHQWRGSTIYGAAPVGLGGQLALGFTP